MRGNLAQLIAQKWILFAELKVLGLILFSVDSLELGLLRVLNFDWAARANLSPRWKKFAPGPVRVISASGLQNAQRVQTAANNARLRARRPVAAPLRADALPLPPPDAGDQPDAGGAHAEPPPPPVLPPGRRLGCTKCRYTETEA